MNSYESRKLIPMPFPKPLKKMTDEELTVLLGMDMNYNVLIPALIEANTRKDRAIAELTKRVALLEEKAIKKAGRPKTCFHLNGVELTDEELMYQIDSQFFTIRKLEKEVGAGKNQLYGVQGQSGIEHGVKGKGKRIHRADQNLTQQEQEQVAQGASNGAKEGA